MMRRAEFSVSRKVAVGWTVWKEGRRDCAVCRVAPSSALFGRWKFWKPQACFANANLDDHSSTSPTNFASALITFLLLNYPFEYRLQFAVSSLSHC